MMDSLDTTPDDDDDDDSLPLRELQRLAGGLCHDCRLLYSAREAIYSIALGFKNAPRCLPCLSKGLGRESEVLKSQFLDYIHRRECYLRAWREAERMDQSPSQPRTVPTDQGGAQSAVEVEVPAGGFWDAGDMSCGDLVLALRIRMNQLPPGTELTVRATDPAAPEDLPAWCRMSGHSLRSQQHPVYIIRRKGT